MNSVLCRTHLIRVVAIAFGLAASAPRLVADAALADSLERIFRPFETDQVALSPSGRYAAYTTRRNGNLILTVRDFQANTVRKLAIGVDQAEPFSGVSEPTPAKLTFLRWATDDRIVFNLNRVNVWSLRADFADEQLLANFRTFNVITPEAKETLNPSSVKPEDAYLPIGVGAPSPLAASFLRPPPIDIVAMAHGGAEVYLASTCVDMRAQPPVVHRIVMRVDATTHEGAEVADVENAGGIIYDREGAPRLYRDYRTSEYRYRDPSGPWTRLAKRLPSPDQRDSESEMAYIRRRIGVPVGFDCDPQLLFCQAFGRNGYKLVSIDTRTWQPTGFEVDLARTSLAATDALVFDDAQRRLIGVRVNRPEPRVAWINPEFSDVQKALDQTTPKRDWDILEWTSSHDCYLAFESAPTDPGTYCLFRPERHEIIEFMNIAPWLGDGEKNESSVLSFTPDGGQEITATLTQAWHRRLKVPPLVVLCREQRGGPVPSGYQREAQALARMGYAVLQVNYRAAQPAPSTVAKSDHLPPETTALDDIVAAIDALTPAQADRRLVAIVGRGYGGYLALRAMQRHPDRFRCAVAIDAPTDLAAVVSAPRFVAPRMMQMRSIALSHDYGMSVIGDRGFVAQPLAMSPGANPRMALRLRSDFAGLSAAELRDYSPATHPERIEGAVLLLEADGNSILGGRAFAAALRKRIPETTYRSLSADESAALPRAQAALFGTIADFLTANIYDYAVKIGALQVVDGQPLLPRSKPELPKPDAVIGAPDPTPPEPLPGIRP